MSERGRSSGRQPHALGPATRGSPRNFYSGQPLLTEKEPRRGSPRTGAPRRSIVIKNAAGQDVRRTPGAAARQPPSLPAAAASPRMPSAGGGAAAAQDAPRGATPERGGGGGGGGGSRGGSPARKPTETQWDGMQRYSTHTMPKRRHTIRMPPSPQSSFKAPPPADLGWQHEDEDDDPEPEPEPEPAQLFKNVDMFAANYKAPSMAPKKQPGKRLFFSQIAEGLEARSCLREKGERRRLAALSDELDKIGRDPKRLPELRERCRLAGVPQWRLAACEPALARFERGQGGMCQEVRHALATMVVECEMSCDVAGRGRPDVVDVFLTEPHAEENGSLGFRLARGRYPDQSVLASVATAEHEPGFLNGRNIAQVRKRSLSPLLMLK